MIHECFETMMFQRTKSMSSENVRDNNDSDIANVEGLLDNN
jgi:hypothetical protein